MTCIIEIGLPSWIINDGNFSDFKRGGHSRFAVQFYAPSPLDLIVGNQQSLLATIEKNRYRIVSKVSNAFAGWWTIEINGVHCFTQQTGPLGLQADCYVAGEVVLSVDPYFYKERLSRQINAPALAYNWKIRKIEIQTAPFVATGKGKARDPSQLGWREINETKANDNDGGFAEYVLHCEREEELS